MAGYTCRVRRLLGIVGGVAFVVWSDDARAICGRGPDATVVPPPIGALAPLNTQVRITMHAAWRTRWFCGGSGPPSCAEGHFDLSLRRAPSLDRPSSTDAVAVTIRESSIAETATVALIPNAPLAPRTRYDLVYSERDAKVSARVVGTFMTGDATDTTAPQWSGIATHTIVNLAKRSARGGVVTILEECPSYGISFESKDAATDDQTPAAHIRYAVWAGDPKGAIDYAATPFAILEGVETQNRPPKPPTRNLMLDAGQEAPLTFAFPGGKRVAKLGVRAIDMAGNVSTPSELIVKLP